MGRAYHAGWPSGSPTDGTVEDAESGQAGSAVDRTSPLHLPLHGKRYGPAVELDPRDFDWVHDPGGHVNQDRGTHADLERSGSDDSGLLKSRVAHRGLAPGSGAKD